MHESFYRCIDTSVSVCLSTCLWIYASMSVCIASVCICLRIWMKTIMETCKHTRLHNYMIKWVPQGNNKWKHASMNEWNNETQYNKDMRKENEIAKDTKSIAYSVFTCVSMCPCVRLHDMSVSMFVCLHVCMHVMYVCKYCKPCNEFSVMRIKWLR